MTRLLLLLLLVGCEQDWGRPKAEGAFAYCARQCNTATLQLTSIELRDHSDGNTVVCHCSVRPESMSVTQGAGLDSGLPRFVTSLADGGWRRIE